ncbi:MAG TPA: hypothetical protein VJ724_14195 [Tahibacter sp.]|nr:hypothetical protein [Tahibacter sp.]
MSGLVVKDAASLRTRRRHAKPVATNDGAARPNDGDAARMPA